MWRVDPIRPRVVWYRRRLKLVRFEYFWANTAYGAFGGLATTRREAHRHLAQGQADMFAEDYR